MKILYGKRIVSALAAVVCCTFVSAQETADSVSEPKSSVLQNTVEHVSFKDRWAFKTNALEWILITPNIGVEFDLSNSVYNKWTLSAQVRWNGGSDQTFSPDFDYSIFDGKLELRRYWRSKRTRRCLNSGVLIIGACMPNIQTILCISRKDTPVNVILSVAV